MSTRGRRLFARFRRVVSMVTLPVATACGSGMPAASAPSRAPSAAAAVSVPPRAAPAASPTTAADAASVRPAESRIIQKLFDDTNRAPSATLKPGGAAGKESLARGLREAARLAASGMEPDGPLGTSALREDENVQMEVMLQPGKCYAIVGYSNDVRGLDLYLLLPPGILSGQDTTGDNAPVIGGSREPMCPVAATPVAYKLAIVANRGAGEVAVQLYSKAR